MTRLLFLLLTLVSATTLAAEERPPNIVFIMSDELAYFELGHMGNPYLKTPRIDAMAKEGLRFTNALAAAPVCGPLRGSLMTGKHQGHCSVRANDGGTALRAEDVTIAEILKQKNYATGGYGKWGAGGRDSTGVPEKHGFDDFFGYYDQVHAHSFYPPYLIRNSEEVPLKGNIGGRKGETYSHYEIMDAGLEFIRKNKEQPFFAYFPITPPHGMYDIPADDPAWKLYEGEKWMEDESVSQDIKNYAAMVSMVDRNLGEVIDLLKELKLEENTIVFFLGDNGGQDRFKSKEHPRGFFMPNKNPLTGVEFRGGKGNLYEGGLKIPFLVRWPGKIESGRTSDLVFSQVDIFRTLSELSGTKAPDDIDGVSVLPEILGDTKNQQRHDMIYWEYGNMTAVRHGKWKAVETDKFNPKKAKWELFDLEKDISETTDLSSNQPEVLKKMVTFATNEHQAWIKGTYSDPTRTRHERDRKAKWGTSPDQPRPKVKTKKLANLNAWRGNLGEWEMAGRVKAGETPKKWENITAGKSIFYNGDKEGKTVNLVSKSEFGDVVATIEFMIPPKSNSGIYFQERYELQILDSHSRPAKEFGIHDCGAIYERWDETKPKGEQGYEGTVPTSNASKPPGKWQTFNVVFRAPRFDANGKKVENARFVSVKLNGVQIHKNVEVTGPTRGGKAGPETVIGPINAQGNHGPVAFRKLDFKAISLD